MNTLLRHLLCTVVLLASAFPYSSQAQTTTATSSPEEPVATTSAPLPVPTAPTPDRSVILEAPAQKRIINLAANISNRLDAIIARLGNIGRRLNTRATKLSNDGYDVSAARVSLEAANTALDAARIEMSTIDIAVTSAIGSQSPKTEWQTVRAKYISARDSIKIAHTELKNAVSHLKSAPIRSAAQEATSTAETL